MQGNITRDRPWAGLFALLVLAISALVLAPPAQAADPVVAAAGNIACDTTSPYYNLGAGTATRCRQRDTSDVIPAGVTAVLPLGDNQYCCGGLTAFTAAYEPTWGRLKAVTRPIPGNLEYRTAEASGYFDYFNGSGASNGPAGRRGEGYYSFDLGAWHLIALNGNCKIESCAVGSTQERWLRADLAAHPASCTLAYMHAPRFSSGRPGGSISVGPLYRALYQAGAEVVLSAHARHYERFAPQNAVGQSDPAFGIRQFVVGTGGHSLGTLNVPKRNSEVREANTFGVLELTLQAAGYAWRFIAAPGATFSDSGAGACHGPPPLKVAPKAPQPVSKKDKKRCTILGTSRNEVLRGTPKRDVICGLGGNDRIAGRGGNDLLIGGNGNDRISGGGGKDRVDGERGSDVLKGGGGNDTIRGGAGRDIVHGQSGADRLFGHAGRNRLYGNAGNDYLGAAGNRRRDIVNGGRGRDRAKADRVDVVRGVERLRRPKRR